jgi:hypothetical protein
MKVTTVSLEGPNCLTLLLSVCQPEPQSEPAKKMESRLAG